MKIIFLLLTSVVSTNVAWSKSLNCTSRWSITSEDSISDLPDESGSLSFVSANVRNSQQTPLKVTQLNEATLQFDLPPPQDERGFSNFSKIILSSKAGIEFEIDHSGKDDGIVITARSVSSEAAKASSSEAKASNVSLGISGRWSSVKCEVKETF